MQPQVVQVYYHGLVVEPDCKKCPLRYDTKVLPDGYYPARLCLVGENPGEQEQFEGRGFVGRSGQLLWQFCKAYGFGREDVWLTNAALCRKRKVRLSTGAELPEAQVALIAAKACRRRLIGELLSVTGGDPGVVIVPLGNVARQMLSSRTGGGVWAYRGSIETIDLQVLWNAVNS